MTALGAGDAAVLIGVHRYAAGTDLHDLPAVENNVADLGRLLTDGRLIGMKQDDVRVVLNPESASAVAQAVEEQGRRTSGTLFVYYAGHGLVDERAELQLSVATSRSDAVTFGRALPIQWLRDAIRSSKAARRVLVLDACFSGLAAAEHMSSNDAITPQATVEGTWTLASSSPNSVSMAPLGARNTAFTGELIRLLEHGVPGGPSALDASYVFNELVRRLLAAGLPAPRQANSDAGVSLTLARNVAGGEQVTPFRPDAPEWDAASRWQAEAISVSVQWPDEEVKVVDRVPDQSYWVVYLANSGERPVHDVTVLLKDGARRNVMQIGFPPIEPSRRRWYILREDSPFHITAPMPDAAVEFTSLGRRWRSERGRLTPLPVDGFEALADERGADSNQWSRPITPELQWDEDEVTSEVQVDYPPHP